MKNIFTQYQGRYSHNAAVLKLSLDNSGNTSQYLSFIVPLFVCAIILFLALVSCQTVPDISGKAIETGFPLEADAFAYMYVDVQNARPLLDYIPVKELKEKQAQQIIDTTHTAFAALYPDDENRRFQLTAVGTFPSGKASVALGLNKGWEKHKSAAGYSYWYSPSNNLSLALNAKQAYISSSRDGKPLEPKSAGITEWPDDFNKYKEGSVLACWLTEPSPILKMIFEIIEIEDMQLPLEQVYVYLFPASGDTAEVAEPAYEALLCLDTANARQARLIIGIINMARFLTGGEVPKTDSPAALASAFLANSPIQDDNFIIIRTGRLSAKNIALLFNYFSM